MKVDIAPPKKRGDETMERNFLNSTNVQYCSTL